MRVAVHCDSGVCHCRHNVCLAGFLIYICDDGMPEVVARDAMIPHLLADSPHKLPMLSAGQRLFAAKYELLADTRPRRPF